MLMTRKRAAGFGDKQDESGPHQKQKQNSQRDNSFGRITGGEEGW
ncbi:hypothetical protein OIN60_13575 [Paenibacillus sp. P96]|uniref:Uncharacterized protein n=1 Tax=Paenibacillus zeirhizosphaerae TaxID=2987519 RepID=A0ABT9FSW3_9BACL|nr:hypothetical protein [Paenibacillus sp. P96]MDP4097801.1 hypothetical protein [Paenibacillus sp. P96]